MEISGKKSMINSHIHIFNTKNVPRYLSKSFLPWPFYNLINITILLKVNELFKFKDGKWKKFYEKWIILKILLKRNWSLCGIFLHRKMITKSENNFKKFYKIWKNEGNEIQAYFNFLHGLSLTTSG